MGDSGLPKAITATRIDAMIPAPNGREMDRVIFYANLTQ